MDGTKRRKLSKGWRTRQLTKVHSGTQLEKLFLVVSSLKKKKKEKKRCCRRAECVTLSVFFFTLVLSRTTLGFFFEYAQNPTFFIEAVP